MVQAVIEIRARGSEAPRSCLGHSPHASWNIQASIARHHKSTTLHWCLPRHNLQNCVNNRSPIPGVHPRPPVRREPHDERRRAQFHRE